jgi:competence protein ComEC
MALIETPNNTKILVDTGPTEKSSGHFAKSALPYFLSNGIEDLDFVFITHSHDDHYGGIFSVFDELNVRNFVVTDEFQTHSIHKNILPYIKKENSRIITISDTTHFDIGDVKITIIHPDEDYSDSNKNNMSIVFKLEYFDFSVLYTGDLEEEGEKYISEKYHPDADVLKVCHHGSKTSSSNIFLKEVSPDYVFIPAPLKNKFNFPHNVTIEKLEDLGENLFSAGKDGALQITTDGKQATFSTILSEKNIIDRNLN